MPRIALAQLNAVVGDIDGNLTRAVDALRAAQAQGVRLLLLPELMLPGYPPEDLLAKDHFVEDNLSALDRFASGCTGISALIGFVERDGNALHNAAALCRGGRVEAVYRKRNLPNYGVFDEDRYFERGDAPETFDLDGLKVACSICEDAWVEGPSAEASDIGARLLVNISASPFHVGKGESREEMLCGRAARNGLWLAYCNLVGGQDELVFDGRSVVIAPDGEVRARALAFAPDLLVFDIPEDGSADVVPGRLEDRLASQEEIYRALVLGLRDYLGKNGFTDVVLGLSGGIDSALTATLAADAIGPGHVHGVLMPSRYSSVGSVADAEDLAANLGIDHRLIEIEGPFSAMLTALAPEFRGLPEDIAEENLQARVRGTLVMALSNKFGWIALATGNKSELSVGYSTLYGDMVGGFAPLKDVYKTRVWDLARWRNRDGVVIPVASIEKGPSAELRAGQLDTDSLPPYDSLDRILHRYIEDDMSRERIVAEGYDETTVSRVCRMVDAAEYKRRQGPLGIRITPKAFGKDRRMPVTNLYRG